MHQRAFIIILFVCVFPIRGWTQQVEVKNNYFYLDGQKFFLKGIGYEAGALPGQLPWNKTFNPGQLDVDISRILSGGFNAIRTWAPFSAEELNYLDKYNIKIIMGIWIDQNGDFSNSTFINDAKNNVSNVLSYSKYHNNIIGYVIMNEPMPETIFKAGYTNTVNLWTDLINIIHTQHPGRPVSIANSPTGTYINPGIFDFSAYNVYIYNPITVNYLDGYKEYIHYLKQLNTTGHPLIITEYGLSVSPTGQGNWGYGGNSFTEQQEGDLYMYKSLVDGGASGSFVFNYSDGWWKAGNEFVHDDAAEEWFGLVNYNSLTDTHGTTRPAWEAIKAYQSAIITQPASSEIYIKKVPLEIFLNDTIARVDILSDNALIYQKQPTLPVLTDTLVFNDQHMKDATLVFNCYDKNNILIKREEKNILITDSEVILPAIKISTNTDFWQTGSVDVNYQVTKSADFITGPNLDYVFYPHVGWNYGQKFETTMPTGNQVGITGHYTIDNSINAFTLGAAFEISYNTFHKRIVNQSTFSRNNTVNGMDKLSTSPVTVQVSPNPVTSYFKVTTIQMNASPGFGYTIYNTTGSLVKQEKKTEWNQAVDISSLKPGIYILQITIESQAAPIEKKLIVL